MTLTESKKCREAGYTLDALRANNWTDAQLLEHGWADEIAFESVKMPTGAATKDACAPNVLGVTTLATVREVYEQFQPIDHYRNYGGYSFAHHILLVADELARRRGVSA